MFEILNEHEYDLLIGGACRDVLNNEKPNDYDIFYYDKQKYVAAVSKLIPSGFKCDEIGTGEFGREKHRFMVMLRKKTQVL